MIKFCTWENCTNQAENKKPGTSGKLCKKHNDELNNYRKLYLKKHLNKDVGRVDDCK